MSVIAWLLLAIGAGVVYDLTKAATRHAWRYSRELAAPRLARAMFNLAVSFLPTAERAHGAEELAAWHRTDILDIRTALGLIGGCARRRVEAIGADRRARHEYWRLRFGVDTMTRLQDPTEWRSFTYALGAGDSSLYQYELAIVARRRVPGWSACCEDLMKSRRRWSLYRIPTARYLLSQLGLELISLFYLVVYWFGALAGGLVVHLAVALSGWPLWIRLGAHALAIPAAVAFWWCLILVDSWSSDSDGWKLRGQLLRLGTRDSLRDEDCVWM